VVVAKTVLGILELGCRGSERTTEDRAIITLDTCIGIFLNNHSTMDYYSNSPKPFYDNGLLLRLVERIGALGKSSYTELLLLKQWEPSKPVCIAS